MRPERAVITLDVICDRMRGFTEAHASHNGNPLIFRLTEEALHWAVIPAISPPTHTLLYPATPQ